VLEDALDLVSRFSTPVQPQPIHIPALGQLPTLRQGHNGATRHGAGGTPALDMFFRLEE